MMVPIGGWLPTSQSPMVLVLDRKSLEDGQILGCGSFSWAMMEM